MQKIKVRTPRSKKALDSIAGQSTTVGDLADTVCERAMYGGKGRHTLSHDGEILRRESQVLDAINYAGAKPIFELVLR